MRLDQAKDAIARYERLLDQQAILTAVIAEARTDWEISSSVTVSGVKKTFALPVGTGAVNNILNNRLANVTADITALRTQLGLDP